MQVSELNSQKSKSIEFIRYEPSNDYPYDLEIFSVSDFNKRTSQKRLLKTFNYEFYMLIMITKGKCTHFIDFSEYSCAEGDLLFIHPSQAHHFGSERNWDGVIVLFRPEFLSSQSVKNDTNSINLKSLSNHIVLEKQQQNRVTQLIYQMLDDTQLSEPLHDIHILLRHQTLLLLKLLSLNNKVIGNNVQNLIILQRFNKFKELVEINYMKWHQVNLYVQHLGCTEKSINRATQLMLNLTAKQFIIQRINLEAKRKLVHTNLNIVTISEQLGFQETTHFTKFFKNQTKCTPSEFRISHR